MAVNLTKKQMDTPEYECATDHDPYAPQDMNMVERAIDLKGLDAWMDGTTLRLRLPGVPMVPLFTEEAIEMFRKAGLSDEEIDNLTIPIHRALETKALAALFGERMIIEI